MAKVGELTVGVVTKVMTRIGYSLFNKNGGGRRSQFIFETYEEADEWRQGNEFVEVRSVYIEESPK